MRKTFIDKLTKDQLSKNQEKLILQNLSSLSNHRLFKTKFGWTCTNKITKVQTYVEFSDGYDVLYAKEGDIMYPDFVYFYKEKNGLPIKEIDLRNFVEDAYRIHRMLKD